MRVMIVDDQPRMRAVIRDAVATVCHEIIECGGGAEALEAYATARPDWVTMDYRMEPMDGFQATTALKQRYPGARVLIVTNYDEAELRAAALEAGADGFVLKEDVSTLPQLLTEGLTGCGGR